MISKGVILQAHLPAQRAVVGDDAEIILESWFGRASEWVHIPVPVSVDGVDTLAHHQLMCLLMKLGYGVLGKRPNQFPLLAVSEEQMVLDLLRFLAHPLVLLGHLAEYEYGNHEQ